MAPSAGSSSVWSWHLYIASSATRRIVFAKKRREIRPVSRFIHIYNLCMLNFTAALCSSSHAGYGASR
ncbi:hypothetical protein QBC46DRAFT_383898 [Diplogelasinospora grovesii]|uniref:Uncharacterized protein n=1 Tax=Diplogelasinospora grovesii TaxID=303347 RepID=A0AAN6N8C0_9PEZI|nr:hypothetical protein QBC46DRAFT_383898 [Diplogelasinospora grovesii]